MGKYDYIKNGNLLYWNAPHNGKSDGEYKVVSAPEEGDSDSIILIQTVLRKQRYLRRNYHRYPHREVPEMESETGSRRHEVFNRFLEVMETETENLQLIVLQSILI